MRIALFISVFVLFFGCQKSGKDEPTNLVPEEKMVAVMVDMHLVETAHNMKLIGADSTYTEYLQTFNSIFESHGVSKADFDSSLMYYTASTEKMPEMYDKVLEELYEMEAEVKSDQ